MNAQRTTETQAASPSTGLRSRLGHVVRWHAEPVTAEETLEPREPAHGRETRAVQPANRPM